jgi:hypothetical protein
MRTPRAVQHLPWHRLGTVQRLHAGPRSQPDVLPFSAVARTRDPRSKPSPVARRDGSAARRTGRIPRHRRTVSHAADEAAGATRSARPGLR